MGVTFGLPVVTFEAPAERMASRRLHLPQPVSIRTSVTLPFPDNNRQPDVQHITHVFHTADPIPMGTCTGVLSSCAIAGYAMESRCHLGKKRLYDTVTKYGWSQDVRTHRIGVIIDRLLAEDWEEGKPVPDETVDGPECDVSHKRHSKSRSTNLHLFTGARMLCMGVWRISQQIVIMLEFFISVIHV